MFNNINNQFELLLSDSEKRFIIANQQGDIEGLLALQQELTTFIPTALKLIKDSGKNIKDFEEKSKTLQTRLEKCIAGWTELLVDVSSTSESQPSKKKESSQKFSRSAPVTSFEKENLEVSGKTANPSQMLAFPSVGIDNTNNNCWANSLLQMIVNSESLSKKILAFRNTKTLGILPELIQEYFDAQIKGKKISNVNSQKLRNLMVQWNKEFSSYNHEDPFDAFVDILNKINTTHHLEQTFIRGNTVSTTDRQEPILEIGIGVSNKFEDLLANALEYTNDDIGGRFQLQFKEAPSELFIRTKRFNQNGRKIDKNIEIPLYYSLPSKFTKYNQSAVYEFTGCIVHLGDSVRVGHYITIAKRGDTWYKIDDSVSKEISEEEVVNKWIPQGYIFKFTRRDNLPFSIPNSQPIPNQSRVNNQSSEQPITTRELVSQNNANRDWLTWTASWGAWATWMVAKGIFHVAKFTITKSASLIGSFFIDPSKKKND